MMEAALESVVLRRLRHVRECYHIVYVCLEGSPKICEHVQRRQPENLRTRAAATQVLDAAQAASSLMGAFSKELRVTEG